MFGKKTKLVTLVMAIVMILSQSAVFAADSEVVLTITVSGNEKETTFTAEQLKAIPAEYKIDEEYVYNSKTGEKKAAVKGVSLAYLVEQAGADADDASVEFTAVDGFAVDPQPLKDIKNTELKYVAAYEVNGEAVDNVTVYRKQKEAGEFGTVFKVISKIAVGEAIKSDDKPEKTVPTETPQAEFTDVTGDYKYAEEAVNALAAKNIVSGKGEGLYAPQDTFTRAEFCKIIVAALGLETKAYDKKFEDVASDSWAAPYIQAAVESGLFAGTSEKTFNPAGVITRQDMAAVVARAAVKLDKVTAEKLAKFVMEKSNYADKAEVAEYAENGVAWLEAEGAFADVTKENFAPKTSVNRAEAAVVIYRTLVK